MAYKIRPYQDEDNTFVVPSWLYSYARGRYGLARGYHVSQTVPDMQRRPDEAKWAEYWDAHHPIVTGLVNSCQVVVACDAQQESVVWGWACFEGDTVHYILVKRGVHRMSAARNERGIWEVTTGLSGDIYRDLLGDRLSKPCGYTHEMHDFKREELRAQGVTVPRDWYIDSTYFARRHYGKRAA